MRLINDPRWWLFLSDRSWSTDNFRFIRTLFCPVHRFRQRWWGFNQTWCGVYSSSYGLALWAGHGYTRLVKWAPAFKRTTTFAIEFVAWHNASPLRISNYTQGKYTLFNYYMQSEYTIDKVKKCVFALDNVSFVG
jgi:hypothetical protein